MILGNRKQPGFGVCSCLFFTLVLVANSALATPLEPSPFSATYEISRNDLTIGEMHVSLQRNNDGIFLYQSHIYPTGAVTLFRKDHAHEYSFFSWQDHSVLPLRYGYDRTGGDNDRHAALTFDWEQRLVKNSVAGHSWTMHIPVGTVDKFSVQLALMQDLKTKADDYEYSVADGGKLKQYRFRIVAEQMLETPAGNFQTIKLQRLKKGDKQRVTYLWCAPSLGYLPVRIEKMDGQGNSYISHLLKVDIKP